MDFYIRPWGRYYMIDARSQQGLKWFAANWRTNDPPGTRATKRLAFLSTLLTFWEQYHCLSVGFASPELEGEVRNAPGILEDN